MKAEAIASRPGVKGADRIRDIGEGTGDDSKKVRRYLQLANLNEELLKLVDEKKIGFIPGVDLSVLSKKEQNQLVKVVRENGASVTKDMAREMKEASREGLLSVEVMKEILSANSKAKKLTLDKDKVAQYFHHGCSQKEMEEIIFMLLEKWKKEGE